MQGAKRDHAGKIRGGAVSVEDEVLYTTIPDWKIPYEQQVSIAKV